MYIYIYIYIYIYMYVCACVFTHPNIFSNQCDLPIYFIFFAEHKIRYFDILFVTKQLQFPLDNNNK